MNLMVHVKIYFPGIPKRKHVEPSSKTPILGPFAVSEGNVKDLGGLRAQGKNQIWNASCTNMKFEGKPLIDILPLKIVSSMVLVLIGCSRAYDFQGQLLELIIISGV